MATEKTTEKLVKYKAFKDNDKYKDDISVIVNGHIWRIQRGVWVELPQYVIDVIEASNEQNLAAANYSEKQEQAYKSSSKNFE